MFFISDIEKHSQQGHNRSQRMLRTAHSLSSQIQLLVDIAVVEFMLFVAVWFKGISELGIYYDQAVITAVLMWLIYSNAGVYRRFSGHLSRAMNLFWAWGKVFAVLIIWAFVAKVSEQYSRQVVLSWFVAGGVAQYGVHIFTDYLLRRQRARKQQLIPSVMVGNSKLGKYLADHINANPWIPHKIVGVVCDENKDKEPWFMGDLPKLGNMNALHQLVEKYGVRRVYFALPMKTAHQIRELELELLDLNVDIIWAPDIFGLHMTSPSVKEVAGVPLYYLKIP